MTNHTLVGPGMGMKADHTQKRLSWLGLSNRDRIVVDFLATKWAGDGRPKLVRWKELKEQLVGPSKPFRYVQPMIHALGELGETGIIQKIRKSTREVYYQYTPLSAEESEMERMLFLARYGTNWSSLRKAMTPDCPGTCIGLFLGWPNWEPGRGPMISVDEIFRSEDEHRKGLLLPALLMRGAGFFAKFARESSIQQIRAMLNEKLERFRTTKALTKIVEKLTESLATREMAVFVVEKRLAQREDFVELGMKKAGHAARLGGTVHLSVAATKSLRRAFEEAFEEAQGLAMGQPMVLLWPFEPEHYDHASTVGRFVTTQEDG